MKNNTLPPTSYPSADDETTFPVTPPQIEGYKILGELGKAGQGRVWRALQLSTRREVALKVPRTGLLSSKKGLARFEREVELAARLKHPNIARIHDSGIHQDRYYYTMELVEGMPLDEYVEQHKLTQRQILELMRTICQAVQHAHQNAVIHRDIKPSNILVTEDGQPHIVDFGLAKYIPGEDLSKAISIDGEMVGTPAYMSPEQALGEMEKVDTRTDVYSLGAILFVLLTGKNPHDLSGSRSKVLQRIAQEEIRRPRKINPKIDKELEALLLKSLDNDPDIRYTSAGELAKDIGNYLKHEPLSAKGPTTIYFIRKRIRKYRRPISIACLLVISFGIGLFAAVRIFLRKPTLTFGVYTSDRDEDMFKKFNPIINHMNEDEKAQQLLKQRVFLTVFDTYEKAIDALVKGEVDFVRFGPASYTIAKNRNPDIQLLVQERKKGKERFKGMIVVRKDSGINNVSDLRGRKIAYVSEYSTIGCFFFRAEMAKAGVYADDLAGSNYLGSHDAVLEAVLEGKFDAAAVKESTYNKYKNKYEEKSLDFPLKVIEDFNNVTKPWIARQGLEDDVFSTLQNILLELNEEKYPEVLKESGISDFITTSDEKYDPVRKIMKGAYAFFQKEEKP